MSQARLILLCKLLFAFLQYCLGCETDEFSCHNGQCIDKNQWCDGNIDCLSRIDEAYCSEAYARNDGIVEEDPNRCSGHPYFYLCSDGRCIPNSGRCDGFVSCSDGSDEEDCEQGSTSDKRKVISADQEFSIQNATDYDIVDSVYFRDLNYKEYKRQLSSARDWLLSQQDESYGWGDYTPRAIVALALSKTDDFYKGEKELLMLKQLDIQLSIALTRNNTEILPLSELALYINALTATCRNPRNFHGFDLVTILRERVDNKRNSFVSPFVFLTLCLNNMTNPNDIYAMRRVLGSSNYAEDRTGSLALASLAFSCIVRASNYANLQYRRDFLKLLLDTLERKGLPGNVYDVSLVIQALNEAKVDQQKWNRDEAVDFILSKQNETGSFGDILATYYVIPILSGNSMLSLATHCNKDFSKGLIPLEILKNTKREKIIVSYSLFFGNPVEMTQKIEIQVPQGTSFLDIMRLAQEENKNFRFKLDENRNVPFVYSIGGIPNDAERGLYWTVYISSQKNRSDLIPFFDDIRSYVPREGEETAFWLRQLTV